MTFFFLIVNRIFLLLWQKDKSDVPAEERERKKKRFLYKMHDVPRKGEKKILMLRNLSKPKESNAGKWIKDKPWIKDAEYLLKQMRLSHLGF